MNIPGYLAQLKSCTTAIEFAQVVVAMYQQEPLLSEKEIVKARFISQLVPYAPNITHGLTVNNLRQRINNALANCPRKRTAVRWQSHRTDI